MNIAVFGASGRTGHLFLEKALQDGHTVVAYARHPDKIRISHERLTIMEGTMSDMNMIEYAVRGADSVIELMGAVSEGTEKIISVMKKVQVRRLIAASAISVYDPKDKFHLKRKLLIAFVKTILPKNVKEVRRAAEIIRASKLDWTLVRIPVLNNKSGSNHVNSGYYGRGVVGTNLARADLATFMYAQLSDSTYIQQAPAISSS